MEGCGASTCLAASCDGHCSIGLACSMTLQMAVIVAASSHSGVLWLGGGLFLISCEFPSVGVVICSGSSEVPGVVSAVRSRLMLLFNGTGGQCDLGYAMPFDCTCGSQRGEYACYVKLLCGVDSALWCPLISMTVLFSCHGLACVWPFGYTDGTVDLGVCDLVEVDL